MSNPIINRALQEAAIQFISYRGPLTTMATFVAHAIGVAAPDMETLTHYMRKEETHIELLTYDVGLWRNTVGDWSLVSLATPPTLDAMRYRLAHFPPSNTCCRWCGQDARRLAHIELIPEKDIRGEPVHNSMLHKYCAKPWLAMRNQVARADAAPTKAKESLI
ncbi:hypothetical protein [Pseudomonas fluorescens group sp. PF-69]